MNNFRIWRIITIIKDAAYYIHSNRKTISCKSLFHMSELHITTSSSYNALIMLK